MNPVGTEGWPAARTAPACLSAALGAAVLFACTEAPVATPTGGLLRLWEVVEARLEGTGAGEATTILREDFDGGLGAWTRLVDPDQPLREEPGALVEHLVTADGERWLELSGRRGGLFRVVPVEPDAFYELRGRVRAHGIVPATEAWFHGATFYLGELSERVDADEVLARKDQLVLKHRTLEALTGTSGWVTRSALVHTTPATRALVVCCVLGLSEEVAAGRVEFDDLVLARADRRRFQDERLRALAIAREPELADAGPSGGGSWRARRLVRQALGSESRPTIVLLPGERLRLRVRVPADQPRLMLGLGPWWNERGDEGLPPAELTVRLDGRELVRERVVRPQHLAATRWRDVEVPLEEHAGDVVELELAAAADGAPGAFGAPLLRGASPPGGPNLLLVSIDTLRADHVGAYGYPRDTTPHLDALAAEGLLVKDVTAQAPYTLPSHVSLFSGQPPAVHGVQAPGHAISPARTPLLAALLADRGWATRAFTAGGFVNPGFGFDRGFDGYSNLDPFRYPGSPHASGLIERRPELYSQELFSEYDTDAVLRWLDAHADERFFLFLHTYAVHDFDPPPGWIEDPEGRIDPLPYMSHEYAREHGLTPQVLRDVIDFYDAALRWVDHELGRVLDRLEALGLADETVIAVTSDHGKELGERGLIVHGTTLYEELTRIPLILRVPGREPRVVDEPAMLIDVAPTLLAALGLDADRRMQGRNLLDRRAREPRSVWAEVDQIARKQALRDPRGWKLIFGPDDPDLLFPNERTWELYHLPTDPGEERDLALAEGEERARLATELGNTYEALRRLGEALGASRSAAIDDETTQMLQQLGYL